MIISRARQFMLFPDPLAVATPIVQALQPWSDTATSDLFFDAMTPIEAEWAYDAADLAFYGYLRIAVTEHPFTRLARLYDRIAQTDTMWQLRHMTGIGLPDFNQWLRTTSADGHGAGGRSSPRWRQHGAWSARHWESGRISHNVRLESIEDDLAPVLNDLGIAHAFENLTPAFVERDAWLDRYDQASVDFMKTQYAWDLAQFGYAAPRQHKAT